MIAIATIVLAVCAHSAPRQDTTPTPAAETSLAVSGFGTLWTDPRPYTEAELSSWLTVQDVTRRCIAVLRLAELDPPTETSLRAVVSSLGDADESVRSQALAGLIQIGRPATRVLAESISDLRPCGTIRYFSKAYNGGRARLLSRSDLAFAALSRIPTRDPDAILAAYRKLPPAPPAEPEPTTVEEYLTRGPHQLRTPHERLLALVAEPTELTSALRGALVDGDRALRIAALKAAQGLGAAATELVPLLVECAGSTDENVGNAAARALANIPVAGTTALRRLARHETPLVRAAALKAYPIAEPDFLATVIAHLDDPDANVRRTALQRFFAIEASRWSRRGEPAPRDAARAAQEALASLPTEELDSARVAMLDALADPEESVREAAVAALATLADARPELASGIGDALIERLSDPAMEVSSLAADRLARFAQHGFVTDTLPNVDRLLSALKAAKRDQRDVISVLASMHIPDERREAVIAMFGAAIVERRETWSYVRKILDQHVGWTGELVQSLSTMLEESVASESEPRDLLDFIDELERDAPDREQILARFLAHPDSAVRLGAAVALGAPAAASKEVRHVLAEGARKYVGMGGLENEAVEVLSHIGEDGVRILADIVNDSSAAEATRCALIRSLSWLATESRIAADTLIVKAADPKDPCREWLVSSLGKARERKADVRPILSVALESKDFRVRIAAASAWGEVGLPVHEIVERLLADPHAKLRESALELVAELPADDAMRLRITEAAISDADESVASDAARAAGQLVDGDRLLVAYVSAGRRLEYGLLAELGRRGPPSPDLVRALEHRLSDEDATTQSWIGAFLNRNAQLPRFDPDRLRRQLESADAKERSTAANALVELGEDPWERGGVLAAVLMDARVREWIGEWLGDALDQLFPPAMTLTSATWHDAPAFPWPPPSGYLRVALARGMLLLSEKPTFGEVYDRLVLGLETVSKGFEHGLFKGVPGGFALVARMERIERDGTPLSESNRWLTKGNPKPTLSDFLGDLFFEKPGFFRVITFVVTDALAPGSNERARLPVPGEGATRMPDDFARQPLADQQVLALVYCFERRRNAQLRPWTTDGPSAEQHLARAGVWSSLSKPKPAEPTNGTAQQRGR